MKLMDEQATCFFSAKPMFWLASKAGTDRFILPGIACYDPAKEKEKLVERITKNLTFGRFLQWSRKKWPNKVKTKSKQSQNKVKTKKM